ncbi:MAG: O-antigen ligase family protein [Planctomycetota bacterium]
MSTATNPAISSQPIKIHWLERCHRWAIETPWQWHVVVAYGVLIPVVAMNLPGVGGLGAADLLMPISFFILFCTRPINNLNISHLAIIGFTFAALMSLLQIHQFKPAVDCTIRWIRLFGILMPFYFGIFFKVDNKIIDRAICSWMVGGLIAIIIGIFLHIFQIEVRQGQQRLWMNGASILRAGGLIGNSGAFGHMTSTWAVISMTYLLTVCRTKLRLVLAGGVVFFTLYVIYISSSRAAMMHLMTAGGVFVVLFRIPKSLHRWMVLGVVYGVLGIMLLVFASQCMPKKKGGGGNSNAFETNMKRFIPGYGGTSAGEFTSNRAGNWPEYIAMMNEKTLFGWGYKMGVRIHEESPDNSYLSVMLETGVLGFTCMSFFVVGVFYRLINLYLAGDPYPIVLLPACVGQLFNCMTSDIYTFWITMPVVFMLLGLVTQKKPTPQKNNWWQPGKNYDNYPVKTEADPNR